MSLAREMNTLSIQVVAFGAATVGFGMAVIARAQHIKWLAGVALVPCVIAIVLTVITVTRLIKGEK